MLLLKPISYLIATLAAISSCEALAGFNMTTVMDVNGFQIRPGSTAQWNISGTPPFNFDVRHRYGPYNSTSPEYFNTRMFWENSTVAVNTTNTTILWVVPQRDYGENWSIAAYVQDSSDNRTWIRSSEERIPLNGASSLKHGTFAMGALCAVFGSVWASL